MDDELELPEQLAPILCKGAIDISYPINSNLPLPVVAGRAAHHFQHSDLGYKYVSGDTFKLKVRGRKYPVFGSFTGQVHVLQKFEGNSRSYTLEGLLEYRMSVLWFLGVLSFFFLLMYLVKPGLWIGALFEAVGSGLVLYSTYNLGRDQRDEVAEHVDASCRFLVNTIENMR
jgi:hypothetical protein